MISGMTAHATNGKITYNCHILPFVAWAVMALIIWQLYVILLFVAWAVMALIIQQQ
jgi:hypothetical protein